MRTRVLVLMVLALLARAGAAVQQQPTFPAATELVTVDAVVLDRDGRPIEGLGREDFSVFEDGEPQELVAFEARTRPSAEPQPPEAAAALPATSSNVGREAREGRSFVIVFDERHLEPREAADARRAVASFLGTAAGTGDRVTLVGTAEGTAWTARLPQGREGLLQVLERLQGRKVDEMVRDAMTDYEAMRIDQDRDPIVTDEVRRRFVETGAVYHETRLPRDPPDRGENLDMERSLVQARAAQVYARAARDNETTLGVVERSLRGLAAVRGRKSLILVSGGLVNDPHVDGFRRAVAASLEANAAIYFLDARGLVGAPSALRADVQARTDMNDLGSTLVEAGDRSEGSEGLAEDTGGFSVRNDNDLAAGLQRIERESGSYYLLGYRPSVRWADERPGAGERARFRKIEVKVARTGARVRARRGYFVPAEAAGQRAAGPPDAAIERALNSPFDLGDVPLRATAHVLGEAEPGKLRVLVTFEADIRTFAFENKGGAARDALEMLLIVARTDSGEYTRFDQQLEMSFSPETRARYAKTWFPVTREAPLAPGAYQARIVARDRNGGRIGTLTHDFGVPEPGGLRISTPILSDRLRDDTAQGPRTPDLIARRTFAPVGLLHCRFEVYGAAQDPRTGTPNVTAGFSIRRSDGRFLAAAPETPLRPGPDGALARTQGTSLDGAPPGRYELIVVVTDLVAGRAAEARSPFEIAEPGSE